MKREGIEMESKHMITLTRRQLYDEIWKLSVTGVAKKYNLHYSKLINSLKNNNIPYPSSAYWTKQGLGKDVAGEIVLLSGDNNEEVALILNGSIISRRRKGSSVKKDSIEGISEQPKEDVIDIRSDVESIEIPDTMLSFLPKEERCNVIKAMSSLEVNQNARLHKNLADYKRSIKEYKDFIKKHNLPAWNKSYYDREQRRTVEPPGFVNDVSDDGLKRAISIIDVMFKAIEKLGGVINQDLSMKVRQDIVRFKFAESKDKIPHEITKQEAKELLEYKDAKRFGRYASKPKIREYDHIYNGKLRIVFDNGSYIRDSVEFKLEDRLADILIRVYEISESNRIEREKREEEHRLYLEEERCKEEKRQRKQLEIENTQALENAAKDYQIACEIRNYITAVMGKDELSESDVEWVEWAKKKADWYDPTMAREDEFFGKREHSRSVEDKDLMRKRRGSVFDW